MENIKVKDYIKDVDENAERRFLTREINVVEKRDGQDSNILSGYAAVFNSDSEDLGGFIERISPGAFKGVLNDNAFALFNHSMNHVLGRNGVNLQLTEDETGLHFTLEMPDTTQARDQMALVKRGIINKCSFAFTVAEERYIKGDSKTGTPHQRIIDKMEHLYDVSLVTIPAYRGTSVVAGRSLEKIKELNYEAEAKRQISRALAYERLKTGLYKTIFFNH